MNALLSIGEFAQLTGLTVKALRFYDERGILRPAMVDIASGYRYYSPDQAALARRVRSLRQLQVPLAEIQILLSTDDSDVIANYLDQHRRRIRQRLEEQKQVLRDLPTVEEWTEDHTPEESVNQNDAARIYKCSFCSKPNPEVGRMIAGPNDVCICNECIALCNEIIEREGLREAQTSA